MILMYDKDKKVLVFLENDNIDDTVHTSVDRYHHEFTKIMSGDVTHYIYYLNCGKQGYDTYDSAIVIAPTDQHALAIASAFLEESVWINSIIERIGISFVRECRLVMASFNAG